MGSDLALLRAAALAGLDWHWGDAYVISFEYGMFTARRRDTGAVVRCAEAGGLYAAIREDYEARPVPRR